MKFLEQKGKRSVYLNGIQTADFVGYILDAVVIDIQDSCRRSTIPYFIRYGLTKPKQQEEFANCLTSKFEIICFINVNQSKNLASSSYK